MKHDQGNYLVPSQTDSSSPNSSKIEIDMGVDHVYSNQSTLKRSPPPIKKILPPPTNEPPPPPPLPMPNGKLNEQVRQFLPIFSSLTL